MFMVKVNFAISHQSAFLTQFVHLFVEAAELSMPQTFR